MDKILIKNGTIVNESKTFVSDIYISNGRIELIANSIDKYADKVIDASGKVVIPGIIDDQVHFREPGNEYKATIKTESRAALLGGVTSFMDMPNNSPSITTQESLEKKYELARKSSAINYSFYLGASNDNLDEILRTDTEKVCGVKIFMGSSTGDLLVDDNKSLEAIFSQSPSLIATHCEDEKSVKSNEKLFFNQFGNDISAKYHPKIRNDEVCYLSSSYAINLAKKYNTRLHVLHLTSSKEMELFESINSLENKRLTAEVCVHHLYFDESNYEELGNLIKCNPAIKSKEDKKGLWAALKAGKLDVIATDHAPHTWDEKNKSYKFAPSGIPLVQHSFNIMFDFCNNGTIDLEFLVQKMCHNPAIAYRIKNRGFIREGYWADLTIFDPNVEYQITKKNIGYKCNWSPLEGKIFKGKVETVIVNGSIALMNNKILNSNSTMRLEFERDR